MLCKLVRNLDVYKACMSSDLNITSAIRHFECSHEIEICNGIIYTRLPHVH